VPVARPVRDPLVTEQKVEFRTEQIAAYARASGDMNPIHLDEKFAKSVGLPGVIAHGMLQMSIAAVVAGKAAGGPQRLRRLSCRFAGMVEPGDEVTITADEVEPGRLSIRAVNQHGDLVLTKAFAEYEPGERKDEGGDGA
jgi:acyl dehydratase